MRKCICTNKKMRQFNSGLIVDSTRGRVVDSFPYLVPVLTEVAFGPLERNGTWVHQRFFARESTLHVFSKNSFGTMESPSPIGTDKAFPLSTPISKAPHDTKKGPFFAVPWRNVLCKASLGDHLVVRVRFSPHSRRQLTIFISAMIGLKIKASLASLHATFNPTCEAFSSRSRRKELCFHVFEPMIRVD